MLANVFLKTLFDRRRAMVWWSVGMFATIVLLLWFYPTIRDSMALTNYLAELPPALRATMLGNFTDISTPEGYLNIEVFSMLLPLLLAILTIGLGAAAVAGEEQRATLDLLLAAPLARWRLVADKFAALLVELALVALVTWLSLIAGARWVGMVINPGRLAEAVIACAMFAVFMGALTLSLGCLRGGKGSSVGVASVVGLAAYLLHGLAGIAESLMPWQRFSPFTWYIGNDPLNHGLDLGHTLLLAGASLLLVLIGIIAFQRRDVGV